MTWMPYMLPICIGIAIIGKIHSPARDDTEVLIREIQSVGWVITGNLWLVAYLVIKALS